MSTRYRAVGIGFWLCLDPLASCASGDGGTVATPTLSREMLLDPVTCKQCHSQHFREWSASMHAYASEDPVFLAMNQRGQEETQGALGNFCVNCHAPLAVREGRVKDGSNAELLAAGEKYQGVTCYFCHNAESVEGVHDNPVRLSDSTSLAARTLRGSFADAAPNPAHRSEYGVLMDRYESKSASLCGSCHDVVLPSPPAPPPPDGAPLHLERTFEEWQGSIFALGKDSTYPGLSCNGCHMKPSPFRGEGSVAAAGLPLKSRRINDHLFPGVDVAFGTFPRSADADSDAALDAHHRAQVEAFLGPSIRVEKVCVKPSVDRRGVRVHVSLDNVGPGHGWPSGATHDRRAWIEINVYREGEASPIYASGVVASGEDVTRLSDPDLWVIGDQALDGAGKRAHMPWDIAELKRGAIGPPVTRDPLDPRFLAGHSVRSFPKQEAAAIAGIDYRLARVTLRIFLQSVGYDVVDDLIASGHLDPALRGQVPVRLLRFDTHVAPEFSFELSSATWGSPYFDSAPTDELGGEGRCLGSRKN